MLKRRCLLVIVSLLVVMGSSPKSTELRMRQMLAGHPVHAAERMRNEPPGLSDTTVRAPTRMQQQVHVKGIYLSAASATGEPLSAALHLLDASELNAVVVDVKTATGRVTYPTKAEDAVSIGAASRLIPDLTAWLHTMKNHQVYTIARIVTFKDPYLAERRPEFAIHTRSGHIWHDKKGAAWVDPYNEKVWAYNLDLAEEAAKAGFDEIQFDYVRFPDNSRELDSEVRFAGAGGRSKAEVIQAFLRQAKERLRPTGCYVSADVFGMTTTAQDDMTIGQNWALIAPAVDIICPMVYPSHYTKGNYGIPEPDLQPGLVVAHAMADAMRKNDALRAQGQPTAVIRPWLQDFTAIWVHPHRQYGTTEVREQIQAASEHGVDEFLLWNPASRYSFR